MQELPVGLDHVIHPRRLDHVAWRPRADHLCEVSQMFVQGTRAGGNVDERPALPLVDADLRQPVIGHHELRPQSESRSGPKRTVLPVRPAVIRALDQNALRGRASGQQLVATVVADVEESTQRPCLISCQQDRLTAHSDGPPAVGLHHPFGAPKAHPRRLEEISHLPGKELGRRVRLAWKGVALPEFGERRLEQTRIDRRRKGLHRSAARGQTWSLPIGQLSV